MILRDDRPDPGACGPGQTRAMPSALALADGGIAVGTWPMPRRATNATR